MRKNIFISYASADTQWATWVADVLMRNGFTVFRVDLDLRPGDDFVTGVNDAIRGADVFIQILSEAYTKSVHCMAEFGMAFNEKRANKLKIISVRVSNVTLTGIMASIMYIDLQGTISKSEAETRLLNVLDKQEIFRNDSVLPAQARLEEEVEYPGNLPTNNLPARNHYFIDRANQFETINNLFKKRKNKAINSCLTTSGLAGIGKTQLAIEYAYRYGGRFKNCIWFINAETTKTVNDCFVDFAKRFDLELSPEFKPEELHSAVRKWLSENDGWLLIFDNLDDFDMIKTYLPNDINGRMIITTRNKEIDFGSQIDLDIFSMDEALLFLKRRLSNYVCNDFDTEASKLITRLGFLPLALELAATYIKATKCTITDYLLSLSRFESEMSSDTRLAQYKKAVTDTWTVAFNSITLKSSRQLLNLCAYMAPDKIPLALFVRNRDLLPSPIKEDMESEITQNRIVTELRACSLTSGDAYYINIHRLIQEVIRSKLTDNTYLDICLKIFLSDIPRDYDNWESKEWFDSIAEHAYSATNYAYSNLNDFDSKEISKLYLCLGHGFAENREYGKSLECYRNSLSISEDTLDKEHPAIAMVYSNIASVYKDQGNYQIALEYFQKALEISMTVQGETHPSTARIYNNIASVYSCIGDYYVASEWYNKALIINEKVLGKEHPDTAITYNNIAFMHSCLCNYQEALKWFKKALAINEKMLGKEHLYTAQTYNNIANIHTNEKDYTSALEWYHKALLIFEKILGTKHPDIAIIYNNIASVYSNLNDYDKALELYHKALAIFEEIFGTEHPDIAITYNNIASIYSNQCKYDKSLEWFNKALAINEKMLGKKHPNTIDVYSSIAEIKNLKNINGRKPSIELNDTSSPFVDFSENSSMAMPNPEISRFCEWYASLNIENEIYSVSKFRMFLNDLQASIKKIKNSLKFSIEDENASELCQYTKLNTLKQLIKAFVEEDNVCVSKFRLSNVAYLNDPSEGLVFIDLLDYWVSKPIFKNLLGLSTDNQSQSLDEVYLSDVYIGCFSTAKNKLPMWTLYGDNSNGCCMVFDKSFFISSKNQINASTSNDQYEQDIKLYRVHYYNTKNLDSVDDEIMRSLKAIATSIEQWQEIVHINSELRGWIANQLDEIRFLFKCDDYSYEEEVRLILRDDKVINRPFVDRSTDVPKLFINVNNPIKLTEVVLGSKVENPSAPAQFLLFSGKVDRVTLSGITYR